MQVVIEFYRTREADNAHAVIGREIADAADLADAVEISQRLGLTLDMPQRPDALSVSDPDGNTLYSGPIDHSETAQ